MWLTAESAGSRFKELGGQTLTASVYLCSSRMWVVYMTNPTLENVNDVLTICEIVMRIEVSTTRRSLLRIAASSIEAALSDVNQSIAECGGR